MSPMSVCSGLLNYLLDCFPTVVLRVKKCCSVLAAFVLHLVVLLLTFQAIIDYVRIAASCCISRLVSICACVYEYEV
jgi:hypothetical protein